MVTILKIKIGDKNMLNTVNRITNNAVQQPQTNIPVGAQKTNSVGYQHIVTHADQSLSNNVIKTGLIFAVLITTAMAHGQSAESESGSQNWAMGGIALYVLAFLGLIKYTMRN